MTKFKRISAFLFVSVMILQVVPAVGVEPVLKAEIVAKIRKEAMENSQILNTLHYYSDVYGPRLTGTPSLEAAGRWSMKRMKEWGFDRAVMEPWDFGSPGWVNERASGFIVSPVKDSLVFEVQAWTPGTAGLVTGDAVRLMVPIKRIGKNPRCVRRPTQTELDAYFALIKSRVTGGILLRSTSRSVDSTPASLGVDFSPPAKRLSDKMLAGGRRGRLTRAGVSCPPSDVEGLTRHQVASQLNQFLAENKPAVIVYDSRLRHGKIRAFGNRRADPAKTVPTVILRNEDYGRIWRLLESKMPVKLEFNIKNTYYPQGATAYNTIGEIFGTDKKDEVIMMGGHLDAWHSATGATDNGIGCAIMMEAGRILKAIGVKPRRTIRVALWSGEEQGLLGSRAYVAKHFGTLSNPKPAHSKFGGYFNVDAGTGRVRRWNVFGPPAAGKILNDALAIPFKDLGFVGALSVRSQRGGSDHVPFNQAGLPGIGARQDPIEYFTTTWHTNVDTYERIVEEDVKATAALVAASVYELAMRDELLPRFSKADMPRRASRRGR